MFAQNRSSTPHAPRWFLNGDSHWMAVGKRLYFHDVSAIGALLRENGFGSRSTLRRDGGAICSTLAQSEALQ
jgi:hypothetical protein